MLIYLGFLPEFKMKVDLTNSSVKKIQLLPYICVVAVFSSDGSTISLTYMYFF